MFILAPGRARATPTAGRIPLGHACTERRRVAGRAERILPLWRHIRMAGRSRWDRRHQRVAGRSRSWRARRGRPRSGFMGGGPSPALAPAPTRAYGSPTASAGSPVHRRKVRPVHPATEESRKLEDRPLRGAEPRPPLRSWRPVRALRCRTLKVPKPWSSGARCRRHIRQTGRREPRPRPGPSTLRAARNPARAVPRAHRLIPEYPASLSRC